MNTEEHEVHTPDFAGEKMKMPENSDIAPEEKSSSVLKGPIIAAIAIALMVILAGLYYWFFLMNAEPAPAPIAAERPTAEENNEPESTTAEAQTETMQTTSSSDELSAIEADLESTDLNNLDAELTTMENELDAAAEAN